MANGVNLFNYIRQGSSDRFQEVVPSATPDNIATLSTILFNDGYQPMLNEFVNNLINRIVLTIVKNKTFSNPLAMFKKGSIPLGTDIQEVFTNPSEAEQYELSDVAMSKLLTITDPDTHTVYYRRNRQDLYTKTIARQTLQGAFKSWDDFTNYVSSIANSLYSGNYIDEFEYTKDLIDGAYNNDKVIVKQVTAPTNETSAKAFLKECRALYKKLTFPSTEYNAYSKFSGSKGKIKTWTDANRIVLITTADVMATIDVEALASAFNIDKANFIGRVVEVDKFKNENILGVLCDESWLVIYDNLFKFDEFYNARTLTWNEYLHAWGTYAISPFANAVVLATEPPVPVETFNLANYVDNEPISLTKSSPDVDPVEVIAIEATPSTTTGKFFAMTSDERVATAEVTQSADGSGTGTTVAYVKITGKKVGNCKLLVSSDNGLKHTYKIVVGDVE